MLYKDCKVVWLSQVFDRDRNGYITSVELKRTMTELGVQLTDEDAQLMIAEADLDGDGKINYHGESFRINDIHFSKMLSCLSLPSACIMPGRPCLGRP